VEPEGLWRLWQPPAETLEAIAGVLRARWRAARVRTPHLLWTTPPCWLGSGRYDNTAHLLTKGGRLIR
jgi:hypothetical protein